MTLQPSSFFYSFGKVNIILGFQASSSRALHFAKRRDPVLFHSLGKSIFSSGSKTPSSRALHFAKRRDPVYIILLIPSKFTITLEVTLRLCHPELCASQSVAIQFIILLFILKHYSSRK